MADLVRSVAREALVAAVVGSIGSRERTAERGTRVAAEPVAREVLVAAEGSAAEAAGMVEVDSVGHRERAELMGMLVATVKRVVAVGSIVSRERTELMGTQVAAETVAKVDLVAKAGPAGVEEEEEEVVVVVVVEVVEAATDKAAALAVESPIGVFEPERGFKLAVKVARVDREVLEWEVLEWEVKVALEEKETAAEKCSPRTSSTQSAAISQNLENEDAKSNRSPRKTFTHNFTFARSCLVTKDLYHHGVVVGINYRRLRWA